MKVYPKIGADEVRFGMTRDEVFTLLGEPDERKTETWPDGEMTEYWSYCILELQLAFSSLDEWRVGIMTLESADINGVNPIGMQEPEGIKALHAAGTPEIIVDDDFVEIGMRDYECAEYELSLWVVDGIITSVSLCNEYDESGNRPIWPS